MEDRKEGTIGGWMSVPAFGEWEHKGVGGAVPDYSVDFSKIRENRRWNKSRVSIGNDDDLLANSNSNSSSFPLSRDADHRPIRDHRPILPGRRRNLSPTRVKKKIMSYFNCCGHLEG